MAPPRQGDDWMVDDQRTRLKPGIPLPKKNSKASPIGSFRHQIIVGEMDITDYVLGGNQRCIGGAWPANSWSCNRYFV